MKYYETAIYKKWKSKEKEEVKVKIFYGGKFIEKSRLEEEGIFYPIKLEYYKRLDNEEKQDEQINYGISIVKTEYIPNNTKIESKDIRNLTQDEEKIEQILSLCKKFEVTPIGIEDIIEDMSKQYEKLYKN